MTTTIHPARTARHRRDPGVREPTEDSWLDPETSPLAVYAERDLPFAPVAVQRERGVAVGRTSRAGASPPSVLVPARVPAAAPRRGAVARPTAAPAWREPMTSVRTVPAITATLVGGLRAWSTRTVLGLVVGLVVVVAVLALLLGGAPSSGPGGGPGAGTAPISGGR